MSHVKYRESLPHLWDKPLHVISVEDADIRRSKLPLHTSKHQYFGPPHYSACKYAHGMSAYFEGAGVQTSDRHEHFHTYMMLSNMHAKGNWSQTFFAHYSFYHLCTYTCQLLLLASLPACKCDGGADAYA